MSNNPFSWMSKGFCQTANPDIFDGDPEYDDIAKGYCERCQVRTECLEYALTAGNSVTGVWGGLNGHERSAQRRGGLRISCPGCRGTAVFYDGASQICLSCGLTWRA
jgi:WhiB family transcriptional regulator, redox-sensing transcriptional regulator